MIYPKFKNREASVRDVRIQPRFGNFCCFSLNAMFLVTRTSKIPHYDGLKRIPPPPPPPTYTTNTNNRNYTNSRLKSASFYDFISDYVEDIYQTFIEAAKTGTSLKEANKELKEMTPLPMNTMLEKEPREEALEKRKKRKEMTVKNVPPTTPCKLKGIFGVNKLMHIIGHFRVVFYLFFKASLGA